MYQTININGSNYKLDLANSYLTQAEKLIVKSKLNREKEKEYLTKAKDYIEKAKISTILADNVQLNNFILPKKPNTKFKDIAGLEITKDKIKLKAIEPLKNPKLFELFEKKFGGGILMYGPPGCGKSFIAEATAGEANATFFNIRASDLKSKYVGETEQNIAKLFESARQHQPSIIFFDEFESLGQERNGATPHDKSMISQLLTEINGLGNKEQKILLIAATNEPWSIDLALRREGRFGTSIFIPPPDLEGRKTILKNQLKNKPIENIDFNLLAEITDFYSGADLLEICNIAAENVLSECIKEDKVRPIIMKDILNAIDNKKELITIKWFNKALKNIYATNNQDSFVDVVDYTNKNILKNYSEI